MKILHIYLLLIFLSVTSVCHAQDNARPNPFIGLLHNQDAKFYIGIESAELAQNKFRDLVEIIIHF